jgi:hypothetical protein
MSMVTDAKKNSNVAKMPPSGRNKFEDLESPFLPPPIPSWQKALLDFTPPNPPPAMAEGYVFPEPALFIAVQNKERQDAYFRSWLKFRTPMIYRVSTHNSTASASPNSLWRNLLAFELIGEKKAGASSTKSSKLWETAQRFMDGCLMADGVSFAESDGGQLMWNGSIVNSLGDHEREEILWELAELSFRFELLALDARVTTNTSDDRQELIRACFPGGASASLLVADLGAANHGLGNVYWEPRSVYLHALKKVMTTWKGEVPPIILARKIQWTEQEIEDLEYEITHFYVKTFYDHFGRAPITPRHLSHAATLHRVSYPRGINVVDSAPNIAYDMTDIMV